MDKLGIRIQFGDESPVVKGEALESQEQDNESRKVENEVEAGRLDGSLAIEPPEVDLVV